MKKSLRKRLVKRLDNIQREILRFKSDKCVQCGSRDKLGVGHIFTRRAYSTRWDVNEGGNAYTQCWPCNYRHVKDQYPYFKWFTDKYGEQQLDDLRFRHKQIKKYKDFELQELYESYVALAKTLGIR